MPKKVAWSQWEHFMSPTDYEAAWPVLKYDAKLKYFRGNEEIENTKKKKKKKKDDNRENRKPVSLKNDLRSVFGLLKTDRFWFLFRFPAGL
jgi:hypothetical protein